MKGFIKATLNDLAKMPNRSYSTSEKHGKKFAFFLIPLIFLI